MLVFTMVSDVAWYTPLNYFLVPSSSSSSSPPSLQRLSIAELLDDKVAARRAYSNLGNAQVFLGKYASAAQYYL